MKSLEMLRDEYSLHEYPKIELDTQDMLGFFNAALQELKDDRVDILKAIKSNSRNKVLATIRNVFSFYKEDVEYYDRDNCYLEKEMNLTLLYEYYIFSLKRALSEEKISQLYKLFDFTISNYQENILFIEEKRDILEKQRELIGFQSNSDLDESISSFPLLFEEELEDITSFKILEKNR